MSKPSFRDIAWNLSPYISDTATLLRACESIEDMVNSTYPSQPVTSPDGNATWDGYRWNYSHDTLVQMTLDSPEIMYDVAYGRKIQAIKSLRTLTGCGLKQAKDAIEDKRVGLDDPKHRKEYAWKAPEEAPF